MKGVAVHEIDEAEYEARRAKRRLRKREPNTKMFKLRDPLTGMYWSSTTRAEFNAQGRKWGSEKAARRNWAEYVHAGLLEGDARPELELVEFHVEVTEKKATVKNKPDMLAAAAFELLKSRYGPRTFVKETVSGGFKIKYLIECEGDFDQIPPELKGLDVAVHHQKFRDHWGASPRSDELLVAVTKDEDIIFLKMLLSENIVAIHNFDEIIAEYHEMMPVKVSLKKRALAAKFAPEDVDA